MSDPSIGEQILEPIYLDDVAPLGLNRAFGLRADDEDRVAHAYNIFRARLANAASQFPPDMNDLSCGEWIALELVHAKPGLLRTGSDRWQDIFWQAFLTATRPRGSRKPGRPGIAPEFLMQVYADVESLKRKLGHSDRRICELLCKLKDYNQRYGRYQPSTLRKRYRQAVELKNTNFKFNLFLSDGAAFLKGHDPLAAAIERWALKP